MNTNKRAYPMVWRPVMNGLAPLDGPATLTVWLPAGQEMTPRRLEELLYKKLLRQIRAEDSLKEAVRIAETMLPNAALIYTNSDEELARSLVQHPSMQELLMMVRWKESPKRVVQEEARQILAKQCLMAMLEPLAGALGQCSD